MALPFRGEESKSISLCVSFAWLVQTIPNIISLNIERIRIQLLFFFVDRIVSCSLYNQLFPVSFLIIIMKLAFLQESSLFYPSLICFIDCCICSRFGNYYIPIYIYIRVKNFRQNYFEKLYANIYVTVHVFVDNIGNSLSVIVRSRIINPRRKRTVCLFFFFFSDKIVTQLLVTTHASRDIWNNVVW